MPWKALPYEDRDQKQKLSKKFKVSGIPTLVILDQNGAVSMIFIYSTECPGRRSVAVLKWQ